MAAPTLPPTLVTDRLILRAHTHEDLTDCAVMWGDKDVVKHIGGEVRGLQDTWFTIARGLGMWALCGYGYWIVRDRNTDALIGEVGFSDFKRGLDPDISEWPEAGWVLAKSAWGQGYATEALSAAHDWFDQTYPGQMTCCIIDKGHDPSVNVAMKLGYSDWREIIYRGEEIIIYQRQPGSP